MYAFTIVPRAPNFSALRRVSSKEERAYGGRRVGGDPWVDIFTAVKTSLRSAENVVSLDPGEVECVEPKRVAAVLERLSDPRVSQDLAETFRVLSDPGRVRLIPTPLEAGEPCVCDLAAVAGLSQTACSHNLHLLRSSRLVSYRKQGRNVYYSLDDGHIRLRLDVGLQHLGHRESDRG